jgi:hypothetical protein
MNKIRPDNILLIAAGLILVLSTNYSCSLRKPALIRLVPMESCAVMSIDWSSVRVDEQLRRVIRGDQFEVLFQKLGIDSQSVTGIIVFSAIDSRTVSGMLLRGALDEKRIAAELKRVGWIEDFVEGHTVYVHTADYFAIPAADTVFVGTREAALAVFRAAETTAESIVASDAYKKINAAVSMDSKPIKAYLLLSEGTLEMADGALSATSVALSLFNLGGIGQLLKAVNVARGFAFSLGKGTRENYPVELRVLMRDEAAATFISGSLNALKTMTAAVSANSREQENFRALQQMRIVRKHEVLAITMEMPVNALIQTAETQR